MTLPTGLPALATLTQSCDCMSDCQRGLNKQDLTTCPPSMQLYPIQMNDMTSFAQISPPHPLPYCLAD
jgi:hypothetical protein